jgi:hypothetical protein
VQEATAEQKFTQMKMEARLVCQNMLLHMGDMRKELLQTTVLSEALKYAQIMRRVKEARPGSCVITRCTSDLIPPQDVNNIRKVLPPLQPIAMPVIHAGEEKIIAFQKTVNSAIRETEVVLVGLQTALASCTAASQLLPLVRLIKPLKTGLGI